MEAVANLVIGAPGTNLFTNCLLITDLRDYSTTKVGAFHGVSTDKKNVMLSGEC